ncbi:phosphotransferase [Jeotgalibacillus sp. ET6]|uniref:phosphotransferase enzyme family protein n=1 Tax=Jeotgalibacillus sp. ET6 TaxID=3037260 RepID=UPI0024183DFF|nr:phosphotransferase [Jeotgalibacillus sp. ET6]MDG5470539.1 phosphotransferase [Jeotgalibacillus sp. ET6]
MRNEESMICTALEAYGEDSKRLNGYKKLPENFHGDHHYQIQLENKTFSARFIGLKRYDHAAFGELTDNVLTEQMRFCDFLNENEIPFMRRKPPVDGNPYIHVNWKDSAYRFLLFEWMEGRHITHCTEEVAYKMGKMVRRYHEITCTYSASLPKVSHIDGYEKFIKMIRTAMTDSTIDVQERSMLHTYLQAAEHHIKRSAATNFDFIMQSDLNPLNILWDETDALTGIIDFEHIGYTDRIEGLAWLIKWYARPYGIGSNAESPKLAQSLLKGYGAEDFLNKENLVRLQSLVWLSGCMNWGFTVKTLDLLKEHDGRGQMELNGHLIKYQERGEKLKSLVIQ